MPIGLSEGRLHVGYSDYRTQNNKLKYANSSLEIASQEIGISVGDGRILTVKMNTLFSKTISFPARGCCTEKLLKNYYISLFDNEEVLMIKVLY